MTRQRKVQLLLWTYFWLLIFEGALRKWVFPGLSNPLLVVRDPVAVLALAVGLPLLLRGPWRRWVLFFWATGIVAVILAVFGGHGDLLTALYGARILILHFPLIFLFPLVFDRDDIWVFVKALLVTCIPMTVLITCQFSLPQDHFLNFAPGGEEGGGFGGAMGKYRPPGTFSFTNGVSFFYPLAAAMFVAWITAIPKRRGKWIWASAAALILALPISISRTILFNFALVLGCTMAAVVLSGRALRNLIAGSTLVVAIFLAVSQWSLFKDAEEVFSARWQAATESEGGEAGVMGVLALRVGGTFAEGLEMIWEAPLTGAGIGLGTNVGAKFATGERGFLISEGAWAATIGELGPLLGVILLLARLWLAGLLAFSSVVQALKKNALPLILCSSALPAIVMGSTAQPTALGFIVISCGLVLAACNPSRELFRNQYGIRECNALRPENV
jgi:hypothetical protein